MKKGINILLLLTSLIGHLEWGKGQHTFLFQIEYDLILKKTHQSDTFLHPFVIVPLFGQLLLLFSTFQKTPGKTISIVGLFCLSTIMFMLLIVGLMTKNIFITISAVPFFVTAIFFLYYSRKPIENKGVIIKKDSSD